jgi:anti-sigma factor RsiW
MNCKEMGDRLLDLVSGIGANADTEQHLHACESCAEKLASLSRTMALLDEWQAPEPSPYFDTRLHARLREQSSAPARGWLGIFRKPTLALSMAGLMAVGAALVGLRGDLGNSVRVPIVDARPGSAVADLSSLDRNHDLLANFDLLDDDDAGAGASVNP